ncbi:MAG: hypothetical protein WAN65_31680 [Candidatus Sulfotelmatobacter sp.]
MPTVRILRLDRALTLHLYRAPGEENVPKDLRDSAHDIGLEPHLMRQNPATHDVWALVFDLAQHQGPLAATGAALLGVITLWLKQRKGRRVEIERHDLKVKAPSARELQKALSALHNYDELTLALHGRKPPELTEKKKATTRTRKNS